MIRDRLLAMKPREKFMLAALILLGLITWATHLRKESSVVAIELRAVNQALAVQEVWLQSEAGFDRQLSELKARIDPSRTLNDASLIGLLDETARGFNLRLTFSVPETRTGELFKRHTVVVDLRNARMNDIIRLERALQRHYPYVYISDMSLTANRTDPRLINLRLAVTALEMATPVATSASTPNRSSAL